MRLYTSQDQGLHDIPR